MFFFDVLPQEWQFAKQLKRAPNGSKISYNSIPLPDNTRHSFIKINNKIYALARGKYVDPVLNQGVMGETKYAQDEYGNLYVIKITSDLNVLESKIVSDLLISDGFCIRLNKNKQYTILKYLGQSLDKYLLAHDSNLTDALRLHFASQLFYKLYRMHYGVASISKTPYAHNDLKPDNVTVDSDGIVHLIDFGLSTKHPKRNSIIHTGAYYYTAYIKNNQLTGMQLDTIAAKRTVFLPKGFYCSEGYVILKGCERDNLLLTEAILKKYDLQEFIDTSSLAGDVPDYSTQVTNSIVICAGLINALESLDITRSKLKNDLLLCHAICGIYFSSFSHKLKDIIVDKLSYRIAGMLHLHNAIEIYPTFRLDTHLVTFINQVTTTVTAFSLFVLNQLDLSCFYEQIIHYYPAALLIEKLYKNQKTEFIHPILKHNNESLIQWLLTLSISRLEFFCKKIHLMDIKLCELNHEDWNIFAKLLQNPHSSEKHIDAFSKNETLRMAVSSVWSSKIFECYEKNSQRKILNNLFDFSECVKTVMHCNALKSTDSANKEILFVMLLTPNACQNFNILFEAGYRSIECAKLVLRNPHLVLQLQERHWVSQFCLLCDSSALKALQVFQSVVSTQITEAMVRDDFMCQMLRKHSDNQNNLQLLLILFEHELVTQNIFELVSGNPALVQALIAQGSSHRSQITGSVEPSELKNKITKHAFLLMCAEYEPRIIDIAEDELKNDFQFMCAAAAKNIKTLEYATLELRSNIDFMREVSRVHYKAFHYACDRLKNDAVLKTQIKRSVLHYQYVGSNRFHIFKTTIDSQNPLYKKYKAKEGDALKAAILKAFKYSLEGADHDRIVEVVATFCNSEEYALLRSAQGITSRFFKLSTSSVIAVDKIIKDAFESADCYLQYDKNI